MIKDINNENNKIYQDNKLIFLGCGINKNSNLQNDITLLNSQGVNNLIPILKLCLNNQKGLKNNILYFMKLVYLIIYDREKNMKNILENDFFEITSLFFEKMENTIFDDDLFNVFIDILKHLYQYNLKIPLFKIFLKRFILNERILLKFGISKQLEMWETLYNFMNQSNDILKLFDIENLLLIVIIFNFF